MADTGRTTLPVAAIIPARDAGSVSTAVAAILAGRAVPREVVVVDDGSRTRVGDIPGARVIRTPGLGRGPARNIGARNTTEPLLWFVDADVLVSDATLELLHAHLAEGLAGVMAVYSDQGGRGYQSFRLTQHRYHVIKDPEPRHMSAACVLLLRSCYDELGGFPDLPAMEDVAFGLAGTRLGYRWRSLPAATVLHLPRPTAFQVIARDHTERGMAAVELAAHEGLVLEHAVSPRELVAAGGSVAFAASLLLPRRIRRALRLQLITFGVWMAAEWPWLRYAQRRKGLYFALASLGWLVVFRLAVITGVARGVFSGRS
jgi:GT2 family glycosyltransferase